MLEYIRKNIDKFQELVKQKLNAFLSEEGYSLIKDEHNKEGIETRLW